MARRYSAPIAAPFSTTDVVTSTGWARAPCVKQLSFAR